VSSTLEFFLTRCATGFTYLLTYLLRYRPWVFDVFRTVSGCCCRQNSGGRFCWSLSSRRHYSQTLTTVSQSHSPSTHWCASHGPA